MQPILDLPLDQLLISGGDTRLPPSGDQAMTGDTNPSPGDDVLPGDPMTGGDDAMGGDAMTGGDDASGGDDAPSGDATVAGDDAGGDAAPGDAALDAIAAS